MLETSTSAFLLSVFGDIGYDAAADVITANRNRSVYRLIFVFFFLSFLFVGEARTTEMFRKQFKQMCHSRYAMRTGRQTISFQSKRDRLHISFFTARARRHHPHKYLFIAACIDLCRTATTDKIHQFCFMCFSILLFGFNLN